MALRLLNELLKSTLKELHLLQTYDGEDEKYEVVLRTTMEQLVQLLNYPMNKADKLEFTVASGEIEPFKMIYSPRDTTRSRINILQYIDSYGEDETQDVLSQITRILADHLYDNRTIRIKTDYELIVKKFSDLIEGLMSYHKQAESQLQDYLTRCISYESIYYSNLQDKLDLDLHDQDTKQIVDFLDSIVKSEDVTDSMFSVLVTPGNAQLGLSSNNPDFNSIYNMFLQIILGKNLHGDFHKYARVMIDVFKKHAMIEYFELNETRYRNQLHELLLAFFLDGQNPILPNKFDSINRKIVLSLNPPQEIKQRPISRESNTDTKQLNGSFLDSYLTFDPDVLPKLANEGVHPFSREDQIKLFHTLLHIVPLLNEFNLNFNPKFPYILKYFLKLVYEILPSISIPEDLAYINKLLTDVNIIVDFENEDDNTKIDIKATVENFHKLHLKLVDPKTSNSTLLMRYANLQFNSNYVLKSSAMNKWKNKETVNLQLRCKLGDWHNDRNIKSKQTTLKKWFSLKQKLHNIEVETMNFYRLRLLYKVLMQQWQSKVFILHNLLATSQKIGYSKFWNIWANKLDQIKKLELDSDTFDSQQLSRKLFDKLKDNYMEKSSLKKVSIEFDSKRILKHNSLLKEYYLQTWYRLMNSRMSGILQSKSNEVIKPISWSEKVALLTIRESDFIMKKFLYIWLRSSTLAKQYHKTQLSTQKSLLSYTFNGIWIKKFNMIVTADRNIVLRDQTTRRKVFYSWRKHVEQERIAMDFYHHSTLRNMMKYWKLRHAESSNSERYSVVNPGSNALLSVYSNKLHNFAKLKLFLRNHDLDNVRSKLQVWQVRYKNVCEMNISGDKFIRSNVGQDQFYIWVEKIMMADEMIRTADLNIQRKYFNSLLKINYEYRKLDSKIYKFTKNGNFCDRLSMQLMFRKWRNRYEKEFEKSANSKLQQLNSLLINPNLKSLYFRSWIQAYNNLQSKKLVLNRECQSYGQRSTIVKVSMGRWRHNVSLLMERNAEAEEFNKVILNKKYLIIWYNQRFDKLVKLNEASEIHIARKEINVLEEIIHTWSRKVVNTLKRNQESCDSFIGRWESLKLRGMLGIWLVKYREKLELEDNFDGDISNISNPSPLAQRRTRQEKNETTMNRSYLYTPIKEQANNISLNTPRTTRGSPTKLQETTQRLKSERINALRQYLSKAKGPVTSTPERKQSSTRRMSSNMLNSQGTLENSNTLLPPTNSKQYLGIVPPAPPNFDVVRNVSLSSGDISKSTTSNSDVEKATIDSAKKLRRITPIKFPTEEDLNLPRFSPVGKLKERLRKNLQYGIGNQEETETR